MATPLILGPDGVLRERFIFSTTQASRFFTGTMDANTADMEVSINGDAFTNDAEFITFEGTSWTIPNPEFMPDGLDLESGSNTIRVRSISTTGITSSYAEADVTLVSESDLGVVATAPTNVSVQQNDATVTIAVEGLTSTGFRGFNFYASLYEGGGETGYQRINVNLITSSTTVEEIEDIGGAEVDADVATLLGGAPAADPLYYRLIGSQEDEDGITVQSDFSERLAVDETVTRVRTTYLLQSVRTISQYSFEHNRLGTPASTPPTVAIGDFAALSNEDMLYYVVSAVFYDSTTNIEFESAFSPEVVARPLRITATIGSFPALLEGAVAKSFVASVLRTQSQVRVDEGSGLRDVVIDPFSTDAERMRFVLDYLHRSRSPSQLLVIDDPRGTGQSSDVSTSAYKLALKRAFLLQSNREVQLLIDSAFEAYASNFGVFRRSGKSARGEVTFWTKSRPTRTIPIPLGTIVQGGSQQFVTTRTASLPLNQLASFFDPVSGRYQVTVPVRAVAAGTAGIVAAGQIRRIVSSVTGLSVINSAATFGGEDVETNRSLVERARRKLASVDSGTKQGIQQTAADVPGVERSNVVVYPNPLMQRDLDADGVHRGGKADVWVQGTNLATVTDTFAFTFEIGSDIQFTVFGDPGNLRFVAVDPLLSTTNPIIEMLDYPDSGYEFVNATTGETFDLTGVVIESYNTIKLDEGIVQPSVSLTDVVLGSYRRRASNTFVLPRQPVTAITDVTGTASGQLPSTAFELIHPESPLGFGRSALASDRLSIIPYTDGDGNTVPSGTPLSVTDETHTLLNGVAEPLDNLGVSFLTVVVKDVTGMITYRGPNDPSGISDYVIILGDEVTPLSIQISSGGGIVDGQTVLVSYDYDENFTVTYTTNLTVAIVQEALDAKKHVTADIIVKDAVPVPVDLQATVVLNQGAAPDTVDAALRTNFENYMSNLRLGDPFRQSDAVRIIENTAGVSYVVLPLTLMVRQEGSQVVRESLTSDLSGDVVRLDNLSSSSVGVWLIKDATDAATSDAGGPSTEFRGVFEDDIEMDLLEAGSLFAALGTTAGRAYIIGSQGAVLSGYTDDATLAAQDVPLASRASTRQALTANRVVVSLPVGDSPVNHQYAVTYIVAADTGAKNIDPGDAQYVTVGDLFFTKDEDDA